MSRVLLDTGAFLWWLDDSPLLSRRARKTIGSADNDCLVSLASAWEMAIKAGLGKLRLPQPVARFFPEQLAANRFSALAIELRAIAAVETLPPHHRDPFDRLLVAQALTAGLPVVSADAQFDAYGVKRIW
ncbi:MAG: type II toxin-antitoxin system VapC family toxin [Rhodocyclaceae bacterium]|nr:type II toxin-antitoxin system VapC family toxin [Rhodocyclaceae bacterium]